MQKNAEAIDELRAKLPPGRRRIVEGGTVEKSAESNAADRRARCR